MTNDLLPRAQEALHRRDPKSALFLLSEIPPSDRNVQSFLDESLAHRLIGDIPTALIALERALELEPKNFLALLSKGALLERVKQRKAAAIAYSNALAVAPRGADIHPTLKGEIARALQAVRANNDALAAHLEARVRALRERFQGEPLDRFDESLEIFSGRTRPYVQEPLLLHYPRLPAIPFYDRALFPWLADLEAATSMIQDELAVILDARPEDFAPYIAFPPGVPVNQWGELNHSRRWSSFFLWKDGVRQEGACALCPRTSKLLDCLPLARQLDFAPTAIFSMLEPKTRIPPHTGSANTRLLIHLPLVLPGPARFRVGNVTREWRIGEAWVFDDTIEHEAWNDADKPRTILILDVWNPFLSSAERELVSAMMTAKNAFLALP